MLAKEKLKLSIVIPVLNEEEAAVQLHGEVVKVLNKLGRTYEIIFIDDGSTDNTFENLSKLDQVTLIQFRKNFGQTAAMQAGIDASSGEYIITMDGDGQNDPNDIPLLIDELEKHNLDVVAGWRKKRRDRTSKKIASRAAAFVRKMLLDDGIHDSGCSLKIFKKECFDHVEIVGEMHRFIPAILKIKGFSIGEVVVNHRPRVAGVSKYNWTRGIRGIIDMFSVWFWSKYSSRPLHLFGGFGILIIAISILSGIWVVYLKLFEGIDLSDTALTDLALFGFLIGIQFFVFGLLADILSKSYFSSSKDVRYEIKKKVTKE